LQKSHLRGLFSYQAQNSLLWKTLKPFGRSRPDDLKNKEKSFILSFQGGLKAILTSVPLPLGTSVANSV